MELSSLPNPVVKIKSTPAASEWDWTARKGRPRQQNA